MTQPRFIRMPEVTKLTGLSRSMIYKLMKANQFPKPHHPSKYVTVWFYQNILEWQQQVVAGTLVGDVK